MIEARTFVNSFEDAKRILKEQNAVFKGEYKIHNVIYESTDPTKSLGDIFLRLRMIPLNIWNEKSVIVAIKKKFSVHGWQYDMGEDQVDLEDIEGHLSIEFKSKTDEEMECLLKLFNITSVITGPSALAVKEILNK